MADLLGWSGHEGLGEGRRRAGVGPPVIASVCCGSGRQEHLQNAAHPPHTRGGTTFFCVPHRSGKPTITAKMPFPVKHLHANCCDPAGIDSLARMWITAVRRL
jgi:hypothetical protein